jgi:DNA-binding MurR/RpiR family transcriptional regulator
LSALRHTLDMNHITAVAERLRKARHIFILGGDLAACLVGYLEYHLSILGLVAFSSTTTGRTIHMSRTLNSKDVVVAISFRRGLRSTVEGMQRAKDNGAHTVGLTDTYISPIARYADEFFLASVETPGFGASYAAPIALLNVLLLACANVQRDRTLEMLRKADEEQRSGYRWYSE